MHNPLVHKLMTLHHLYYLKTKVQLHGMVVVQLMSILFGAGMGRFISNLYTIDVYERMYCDEGFSIEDRITKR